MLTPLLIAAVVGYFLGALPFGYLVARSKGINIFEHGSKNPGATNVKRVCGKGPGNLVFALDALKGAVATGWPLLLAAQAYKSVPDMEYELGFVAIGDVVILDLEHVLLSAVIGLVGALIGHSFSCFTKFKGGKGVATATGGFLVLMPVPLLIGVGVWVVFFYATRFVSLASMLAAAALPVSAFLLKQPPLLVGLAAAVAVFVALRHRTNIGRLLKGTEPKFSSANKPTEANPAR